MAGPTRVWVLVHEEWEYDPDGPDHCRDVMDSSEGFFLLEVDAQARADYLNRHAKRDYVQFCRNNPAQAAQSFERWAANELRDLYEVTELTPGLTLDNDGEWV